MNTAMPAWAFPVIASLLSAGTSFPIAFTSGGSLGLGLDRWYEVVAIDGDDHRSGSAVAAQ